ncbi:hypothetical protein FJTKL_14559 [Diaporthe vaccinii]|uniref:Uncharacterized protein n=1 Tax=Diaporthe vaccinii TaxID=105482 RepID=A0ABR4E7B4_9PEZI
MQLNVIKVSIFIAVGMANLALAGTENAGYRCCKKADNDSKWCTTECIEGIAFCNRCKDVSSPLSNAMPRFRLLSLTETARVSVQHPPYEVCCPI